MLLHNLGVGLLEKYNHLHHSEDLDESIVTFATAAMISTGDPFRRSLFATQWINCLLRATDGVVVRSEFSLLKAGHVFIELIARVI